LIFSYQWAFQAQFVRNAAAVTVPANFRHSGVHVKGNSDHPRRDRTALAAQKAVAKIVNKKKE